MKRWIFILVAVATLLSLFGSAALAGNGAPNGAHYNLNIIGVDKGKTAEMTGNNGGRIFVWLDKQGTLASKIMLSPGDTFKVTDANGTDGTAAFTLPYPDLNNDGWTDWSVYARALGKRDGYADMKTCAWDPIISQTVCSLAVLHLNAHDRPSKFTNVTQYLAYIYADLDGGGAAGVTRTPLFGAPLSGYFWQYDNYGLKLAQLRFYECATQVPAAGGDYTQILDTECVVK